MAAEFDEVLRIVESDTGFETLGGLEGLKTFLRENVIGPMREGQHSLVPQGLLLMGPAGTGKSRIAKALAKEAGVTFVELQPSKIFSKWVGETERSLERALTAIRSMTPCIVFIDEVDQSVNRGEGQSGDSGVSNRFFKRLMEFMGDTTLRGKVLFIAATNRPDLLDAALSLALENCSDLELVPQAYHGLVRQLRRPAQVEPLNPETESTNQHAPELARRDGSGGGSRSKRKMEGLEL